MISNVDQLDMHVRVVCVAVKQALQQATSLILLIYIAQPRLHVFQVNIFELLNYVQTIRQCVVSFISKCILALYSPMLMHYLILTTAIFPCID